MGQERRAGKDEEPAQTPAGSEPTIEALATLGRQTAATVHELNNVLTSVLGWAQVALRDADNRATVEGALRTIEANSRRARRILRDTLDGTLGDGLRRPTLTADIVDDALRLLAWELRRAGVRVLRLYQVVPEVNVDRGAIQQIVVNLVLNAVQAMPKGGELQIRVRPLGAGVAIDVADTGTGMTEDVAKKAFEPFFSTKSAGGEGGSGLGLAIARRLAEAHGGMLDVTSAPGLGSTFTLQLPVGTATAEEKLEPVPAGRTGRILVIDDEADIRELLATALALRGHTVETAGDAATGEERAVDPDVSLVLLDYSLPGVTGSQVLRRLRTERPDLPVLFMSGRTGSESGEYLSMTGPGPTGWLRKPFDLDEVYREVARLLPRE